MLVKLAYISRKKIGQYSVLTIFVFFFHLLLFAWSITFISFVRLLLRAFDYLPREILWQTNLSNWISFGNCKKTKILINGHHVVNSQWKRNLVWDMGRHGSKGGETGEFLPPFFESPSFFLFLIPQILIGSNTLLQKFTHHFKILDPRLMGPNFQ